MKHELESKYSAEVISLNIENASFSSLSSCYSLPLCFMHVHLLLITSVNFKFKIIWFNVVIGKYLFLTENNVLLHFKKMYHISIFKCN